MDSGKIIVIEGSCDGVGKTTQYNLLTFEFKLKVYDTAMFVADYLNWEKVKCDENNEMKSIDLIAENIDTIINTILQK